MNEYNKYFKNYYLESSINYFKFNFKNRLKFIKKKIFLFKEISFFINNCISHSKKTFMLCAGNSIIGKNLNSKKISIKEINPHYEIKYNKNINYVNEIDYTNLSGYDSIIVADIEHQSNPTSNLLELSKNINDDARIIVLSKNLVWMFFIKILKFFFNFSPQKNNFLPASYLENLYSICNLEIIRNEKIIALPFFIPFVTNFINKIFRLPFLSYFCISSITVLKKVNQKSKADINSKVSFIIPCKNEQNNIIKFKELIKSGLPSYEYLFGDDKSCDKTNLEIDKLCNNLKEYQIIKYNGPGISKSENVYRGIDYATGDIIVIYDADLTVSLHDINFSIKILQNTNADFINCTRMIYPQKKGAMKFFNFLGNNFFANLFSFLFKRKITDTLCGTKIFYKKDWIKIKKDISNWGVKDLWGDFDLLLGAYNNNLKITEIPVTYYERKEGHTKMTSIISNTLRMLAIVLYAYYKLRLKK